MPPSTKKQSDDKDGKHITWDEVVAKFSLHGITPQQLGQMTLKQAHFTMREWGEDLKMKIRLAGGKVEEEDKEATLQDLLAFGM